ERIEQLAALQSSPRTWGCFSNADGDVEWVDVFPTHVGVFPPCFRSWRAPPSLPHARGGVSAVGVSGGGDDLSSPRTWGCFSSTRRTNHLALVFPTHVGVFPISVPHSHANQCLPHA